MKSFDELYIELCTVINTKLEEIKWVDLWNEQVSFLTTELPFSTPALFIEINTNDITEKGQLIQDLLLQIDFYLFWETFDDTYLGSYNQGSALEFLKLLNKIHVTLHGLSGENFGTLTRVAIKRIDSGGTGNLYNISFVTSTEDSSAQKEYIDQEVNELNIELTNDTNKPSTKDEDPSYLIEF